MSKLKLQFCSTPSIQSSAAKNQQILQGNQQDPISALQQENLINLGNIDQKRRSNHMGDRFIPTIKKKFSILTETKAPAQDMASSQAALEMLYKQQILDQGPVLESENGSLKFINQNNFQYKNEHIHFIDSIDPKNYNSPLVDHKYSKCNRVFNHTLLYQKQYPVIMENIVNQKQLVGFYLFYDQQNQFLLMQIKSFSLYKIQLV